MAAQPGCAREPLTRRVTSPVRSTPTNFFKAAAAFFTNQKPEPIKAKSSRRTGDKRPARRREVPLRNDGPDNEAVPVRRNVTHQVRADKGAHTSRKREIEEDPNMSALAAMARPKGMRRNKDNHGFRSQDVTGEEVQVLTKTPKRDRFYAAGAGQEHYGYRSQAGPRQAISNRAVLPGRTERQSDKQILAEWARTSRNKQERETQRPQRRLGATNVPISANEACTAGARPMEDFYLPNAYRGPADQRLIPVLGNGFRLKQANTMTAPSGGISPREFLKAAADGRLLNYAQLMRQTSKQGRRGNLNHISHAEALCAQQHPLYDTHVPPASALAAHALNALNGPYPVQVTPSVQQTAINGWKQLPRVTSDNLDLQPCATQIPALYESRYRKARSSPTSLQPRLQRATSQPPAVHRLEHLDRGPLITARDVARYVSTPREADSAAVLGVPVLQDHSGNVACNDSENVSSRYARRFQNIGKPFDGSQSARVLGSTNPSSTARLSRAVSAEGFSGNTATYPAADPPADRTAAAVAATPSPNMVSMAQAIIENAMQPGDKPGVVTLFGQPIAVDPTCATSQLPALPILDIKMPAVKPEIKIIREDPPPLDNAEPQTYLLDPIRINSAQEFADLPPEMQVAVIKSIKGAPSPLVPPPVASHILEQHMVAPPERCSGEPVGQPRLDALTAGQQKFLKRLEQQIQEKQLQHAMQNAQKQFGSNQTIGPPADRQELLKQYAAWQQQMNSSHGLGTAMVLSPELSAHQQRLMRAAALRSQQNGGNYVNQLTSAYPANSQGHLDGPPAHDMTDAGDCKPEVQASVNANPEPEIEGLERTLVKSFSLASTVVLKDVAAETTVEREVSLYRLFKEPLMFELADFLSETETQRLLALAEQVGWTASPNGASVADIFTLKHPMVAAILRRAARFLDMDVNLMPEPVIYKLAPDTTEANLFQRYEEAGSRKLALCVVVFLTEVPKGGETAFPQLGIAVSPKRDSALAWRHSGRAGTIEARELPVVQGSKICLPLAFFEK